MSIQRSIWVNCDGDGCDRQYPGDLGSSTVNDARTRAHAVGWRRINDGERIMDLCETCMDARRKASRQEAT